MNAKSIPHAMQRFLTGAMLIAICGLSGGQSSCTREQHFTAVSTIGCRLSSWAPEVVSFYGDPKKVMDKLHHFDMKLRERRMYMFMAEDASSAELALFKRPESPSQQWTVLRWKGPAARARRLRDDEAEQIMTNQGKDCVGKQTENLVKELNPVQSVTSDPPETADSAFGDVISRYPANTYIRITVFLLC